MEGEMQTTSIETSSAGRVGGERVPTTIRLSSTLDSSSTYGPGRRFVVWVQGCGLACPGCWNQDLWDTEGGYEAEVEGLLAGIADADDIEGVTILGGEPLEQAEPVLALIRGVRERGLTVMLYSGYEEHELGRTQLECVESSDIVILGRYVASLRDTSLRWRGSSNQEVRTVSDAYAGLEVDERGEAEVTVDADGTISMAGYPEAWLIRALEGL